MTPEQLTLFLGKGILAFTEQHQLTRPSCFISYAWGDPSKRAALQTWLNQLHNNLSSAGFETKLDIKNMQNTVADYMADGVTNSDIILLVCTLDLAKRAKEGQAGKLTMDELDALTADQLNTHQFNSLQKELWFARQKHRNKTGRIFLLLREGDFNSAIPDNFFALSDFLVRDFRDDEQYMPGLITLHNPVGLIPSLLQLPDQQTTPMYSVYQQMLEQFESPQSNLLSKTLLQLQAHARQYAQEIELPQLAHFYISLDGQAIKQSYAARYPLQEKIESFLSNLKQKTQKVCLLLGDAGSGKTTFGLMLQERLWNNYLPYAQSPLVPIRIDLKRFTRETAKSAVHYVFKHDYHLTDEAIEALKTSKSQFVFIFDGYDELSGGGFFNPYLTNHLSQWGINPKLLIGCRIEYVAGQAYKELLGPSGDDNLQQIIEWYLSPLNTSQISEYLARRETTANLEGVAATEYDTFLRETPGLIELVNTPFLLKIFISAYPALKENQTTHQITRGDLYEAFMQAWFKKEKQKLIDSTSSIPGSIERTFLQFSRQLAFAMYEVSLNEVIYETHSDNPWEHDSDDDEMLTQPTAKQINLWEKFFSQKDEKTIQARRGCPLRCLSGTTYSFVHQSFLEYFIADNLWQALLKNNVHTLENWGIRCLMKSPKLPITVRFLAEWLVYHPQRETAQAALYQLVTQSKRSHTQTLPSSQQITILNAASNAITVLNAGLVPFTLKAQEDQTFFRDIQVPYADLTTAELSGVDLTGSDLSYTRLVGVKLQHACLDNCEMTGVDFQQWPILRMMGSDSVLHSGQHDDNYCSSCHVVYTRDGKHLMAFSGDTRSSGVQIYKADGEGWVLEKNFVHAGLSSYSKITFSPEGQYLAATRRTEDAIDLLDMEKDGSLKLELPGRTDSINQITFSSDGQQIASANKGGTVCIWKIDGTKLAVLQGHKSEVSCVAFSPNNQYIVSGGEGKYNSVTRGYEGDLSVRLWSIEDTATCRVLYHYENACVLCVAFAPNSQLIASGSSVHDGRIVLCGIDGVVYAVLPTSNRAVCCIAFSPDGQQLVSGDDNGIVRIWSVDGKLGAILTGHSRDVQSVAFSPDGRQIMSAGTDNTIRFRGTDSTLSFVSYGHQQEVKSVAFSPDSQTIASAGLDQIIYLWNLDGRIKTAWQAHESAIHSVAFSSNGELIASGSRDQTIRLWNLQGDCKLILKLDGEENWVRSVVFSPDNQYLASASQDNTVRLWTTEGTLIHQLVVSNREVSTVIFSRDSRYLALDGEFCIWEVETGKTIWPSYSGNFCVTFSPNSDHVILAGRDITFWNLATETPNIVLPGLGGSATAIAYSPDGQYLAIGDGSSEYATQGLVMLWTTMQPVPVPSHILWAEGLAVASLVFSPDNQHIVIGSEDKTVRIWHKCNNNWVQGWQYPRNSALEKLGLSWNNALGMSHQNKTLFEQPSPLEQWMEKGGVYLELFEEAIKKEPEKYRVLYDYYFNNDHGSVAITHATASEEEEAPASIAMNQFSFFAETHSQQDHIDAVAALTADNENHEPTPPRRPSGQCCVLL